MNRTLLYPAAMLILIVSSTPIAHGLPETTGALVLELEGFKVEGRLLDATIYQDNNVTLVMSVNDVLQTQFGPVSITSTGEWVGAINGTELSGLIENVTGTIRICVMAYCGDTNYIGYGVWTGALSSGGIKADGTFQGTIIFTSSPIPQVPLNRPIPVSGSWNSKFELST